jgi:predicted RNA-binding Zn-ribbon protein involved in translation (DUF1610 family)
VKYVGYVLALVLIIFSVIVALSAFGPYAVNVYTRLFGGIGLLGVGIVVLALTARWAAKKKREEAGEVTIHQQIDLTGDVHIEKLRCESCGAALDKSSVTVKAGAVHVDCPYCGTSYVVEEEPKW